VEARPFTVAKGDAEHHFSPPAPQQAQKRVVARQVLLRDGGGAGAPFVEQRLVAIIGLAIVRFLEPEGIPGILEQKPA